MFDDVVRYKERWQMQNAYDNYHPQSLLPCTNGFQVQGSSAFDSAGLAVATGDINGDGIADLIISGSLATGVNGASSGKVYVIFGMRNGFPDPLPISSLNGTNGFELDGPAASASLGSALATGDVNGDGIPDLIIGASGATEGGHAGAGAVYVIFGHTGTWNTTPLGLTSGTNPLDGTHGAEFDGTAVKEGLGGGFALATGDVNGDGIPDLVMGEWYVGAPTKGQVYVVFGKSSGWAAATSLTSGSNPLDGTHGAEFDGAAASAILSTSVATGDVNGDGIADLIMGAPGMTENGNANAGAVYVVFGKTTPWAATAVTLTSKVTPLDGTHGFEFDGAAASLGLGARWGLGTGDVNGDGIPDLVMSGAGKVYVVFGKESGWISQTILTSGTLPLDGTHGAEFDNASSTFSRFGIGDVNGDGIPDLVLGAYAATAGGLTNAGATYVVFGKPGTWSSATTLTVDSGTNPLDGIHGAEFDGPSVNAFAGDDTVGDINGDGIADVIIGAYFITINGNAGAGTTYVYFGRSTGWPTTAYGLGGL